jgi:uncharacterized protein involved in exopolysaccharide biosynthesis
MNVRKFLSLVFKYKWLLVIIPILTLLFTFFIVKKLPKEYKSEAKLSTGLLDPSRQIATQQPTYAGAELLIKLNQQFTNIIDIMQMPKNMSILSYRLILHDLKNPDKAFKRLSDDMLALSPADRQEAIRLFEERLIKKQVLTPFDNQPVKLYNLVKSMAYDAESIKKKLTITYEQNSDFITVTFTSTNTLWSVFVVNTLSRDFISNYSADLASNKTQSIELLDSLLQKKELVMNEKNDLLKAYKIRNRVLNLDKQSQIVYQQIVDYENKKAQALIDLQSQQAALQSVNNTLNNRNNEKYLGADLSSNNQQIVAIKNKIQQAETNYIDRGFQQTDKKLIDSLRNTLNSLLTQSSDNYVTDPLVAKQTLILKRITLGVDIEKIQASIGDIDRELQTLNQKFSTMVPFDAGVANFEREADVATKEYLDLLNKFNQTNLDKNIGLRLQLEQEGTPSLAEPSKKALYMAISGLASLAICFSLIFVLFAFDYSVNNKKQLAIASKGLVLGELNFIKKSKRDVDEIWKGADHNADFLDYKNRLRALRFEIAKHLNEGQSKVLGITSLHPETFNVFSLVSIAYAFARIDKQILIIGDDETALEVQKWNIPTNQSLKTVLDTLSISKNNRITFLNRDMGGLSLLENTANNRINKAFDTFRDQFDLVIVLLNPLNLISDLNEWILFTDKYISTFEAGQSLNEKDKDSIRSLSADEKFIGWVVNGLRNS